MAIEFSFLSQQLKALIDLLFTKKHAEEDLPDEACGGLAMTLSDIAGKMERIGEGLFPEKKEAQA